MLVSTKTELRAEIWRVGRSLERQEPDAGELRFDYLASIIDELGYDGWIGCEYRPKGSTSAGLGWCREAL